MAHHKSLDQLITELSTHKDKGLSDEEAGRRLTEHGPNTLKEGRTRGPLTILAEQFRGTLVLLLICAAGVSLYLAEYKDAAVIIVIVVLNAFLGFYQDYRAEKTLARLKVMASPKATVVRSGKRVSIAGADVVPGDLLAIDAGTRIAADGRVLSQFGLKTQEAALTGESASVDKTTAPLPEKIGLADRTNMTYAGTDVVAGRGLVLVTATGMQTELGKTAGLLSDVKATLTPLQKRLAELGRGLAVAALVLVAIVFGIGIMNGEDARLMFMTALGLAVAAVPEGLPAVATVALAIGAKRMFETKALIRRLPAVETLGSVTVICSDKTGTLTQNKMTVKEILTASHTFLLGRGQQSPPPGDVSLALTCAASCNDATLVSEEKDFEAAGEPTESALIVGAAQGGVLKPRVEKALPRIDEIPFSSDRKMMSTLHRIAANDGDDGYKSLKAYADPALAKELIFAKGAFEIILAKSSQVLVEASSGRNTEIKPLSADLRQEFVAKVDELALRGFRVLGLAASLPKTPGQISEQGLTFLGVAALIDPPRPEVKESVATCARSGIRPLMITGDHPSTALAIAKELGITTTDQVLVGHLIDETSDRDFTDALASTSVFARVAPKHKLRIVETLQKNGEVVAMTGDGVNDAPALKRADIGVAMGITGTDVSKEAAEMVLLDDDFSNIVKAVREGRIVYDNIRKFIRYTLTSNTGEILVMLLAPLLGLPLPLLPLQILWVNLVTDGLPGLALAVEPGEKGTMARPPHPPKENVFARGLAFEIVWLGLVMGFVSLGAGALYAPQEEAELSYFRSVVFTVLTMSQLGNALAVRAEKESLFSIGLFSNKFLLATVIGTFALQIAVLYVPQAQELLGTTALGFFDLLLCLALSTVVFFAVETAKALRRRRERKDS